MKHAGACAGTIGTYAVKSDRERAMGRPRLLSDKEVNTIRGKASVGHASMTEIQQVFGHLDMLEQFLDRFDEEDTFGTEGWRHTAGVPE